jgi:hypothetical protein
MSIDGGAAHHDIVDDGEAALATDPVALAILDAAVRQYGSLVEPYASIMELLCNRYLIGMEKIPDRTVDNLVGSMAENVNNGVGCIENVGMVGQVWWGEFFIMWRGDLGR